jgi:PAS domain S-box-containing protein
MHRLVVNSRQQSIMHVLRISVLPLVYLTAALALVGAEQAVKGQTNSGPSQTVITNVATVRSLKPVVAAEQLPVRLTGVVTYVFDRRSCFVQDQSAGIFVGNGEEFPDLSIGDVVTVQGVSGPGEYAPTVVPTKVEVTGRTALPVARRASYDDLLTGREDSQWVEVAGLVRAVFVDGLGGPILEMTSGGGRLTLFVAGATQTNLAYLVDSQVRVRGVCGTWFNRQRQLFGVRLLVPGIGHIEVEEPAAANALAQPSQLIGDLLLYAPEASYGRRVKVVGTVVLQQPGRAIFVQDDQHGLYVQTRQRGRLQPGDRVQLIGFPVKGEYTPMLQDAAWERVGEGSPPAPVLVTPDEALGGLHDSRLVQLEGTLLNRSHNDRETVLVIENDKHIFTALLEGQNPGTELATLADQSLLRLTGVCRIEVGDEWRAGPAWRAKSFRILMRSPADVEVLKLPPWWTLTRLLWAVGILTAVVLVSLTWAAVLRRRVGQQTAIIRRQLDLEATLKDRYQDLFENANDMVYTHDLSGRITSINMAGERLLGRDRKVITEGHLADFVAPEQQPAANQWLEHIRDGTAPATLEWDFLTATGERVRLEICTRLIEREGRQVEVEGIARDVTERRRLEKEILEISTREQHRIGHDLHDGVCQQLAGIGFLSDILADKLQEQNRPEAAEALSISELVNKANKQTRGVARGLFPVRLEENGLVSALEELAENAGGFLNTRCEFRCHGSIVITDHAVGHHIYYIAQEAILNAVKHGKAGRIEVELAANGGGGYLLAVRDDGVGVTSGPAPGRGMGIRIMKYRARMIDAELQVQGRAGGGTEVSCRFVDGPKVGETFALKTELTP